ncbi:MAG: aminotransferase class IV [Deltaproteobacteria bacterium]|nr:aminotransferase class IV [Deltaproteobacteria bacterium]
MQVWINGQLVEENEARISLFDRAYLYGEGVFETLKTYAGKPAFMERHYFRLRSNCEKLNIPLPFSEKEFAKGLMDVIKANGLSEAAIRITVSTVGASSNITIFASPITINPKFFETGVKVELLITFTNDPIATAGIKSTSYITKMLARTQAAKDGVYETILRNEKGYWVEGNRTNFFIVSEGEVVTAPLSDGLLPGITREMVLEILKEQKIPHKEDHITTEMIQNAEEIFLTGSTSEVMPVYEVLGVWRKEATPTSLARQLRKEYLKKI